MRVVLTEKEVIGALTSYAEKVEEVNQFFIVASCQKFMNPWLQTLCHRNEKFSSLFRRWGAPQQSGILLGLYRMRTLRDMLEEAWRAANIEKVKFIKKETKARINELYSLFLDE